MEAILIAALLTVTGLNYARFRDPLYPPVLQGGLWCLILALLVLGRDLFVPISTGTYLVIANGIVMFSVGSYLATAGFRPGPEPAVPIRIAGGTRLADILFWMAVLGLPLWIHRAFNLGTSGPFDNFVMNVRFAVTEEGVGGYGLLSYLSTAALASAGIRVLTGVDRTRTIAAVAVAVIYCILSTSRTSFFFLFLMIAGIVLILRRVSFLKVILLFTALGLVIFIALGVLYRKGWEAERTIVDNAGIMGNALMTYALGAVPAFDLYTGSFPDAKYGRNVLRMLFVVLDKIGLDIAPHHGPGYAHVPFPTNVYTVYRPYFSDFSWFGVIYIQVLLGFWHGFLYRRARDAEPFFVFLYAIFLYPLFMQFFDDQYFGLLSMWIQYVAVAFLCLGAPGLVRRWAVMGTGR